MSKFVAEPFTNSLGQVLNPGDTIIYAGTSWKNTQIVKAKFAGVYKGTVRGYDRVEGKGFSKEGIVTVKVDGIPHDKFVWDSEQPFDPAKGHYRATHVLEKMAEEASRPDAVKSKYWYYEPCTRTACLPLKRVYKYVD